MTTLDIEKVGQNKAIAQKSMNAMAIPDSHKLALIKSKQ